ncbi:MAG: hypothetical protein GC184_06165 [Rhizobiales bacterium]|nr:hypothetical protein [Hyphomicrobiales bacterium]
MSVKRVLVDRRNFADIKDTIMTAMHGRPLVGFDIETEDDKRHAGLDAFMNIGADRKNTGKKLVFDTRRTTVTGFSIYPDGHDTAYYFNLAHADVENRLEWLEALEVLQAKDPEAHWVIHNAPFELVMCENSLDWFGLWPNAICTLQLCVSAYGPDDYDINLFRQPGMGDIAKVVRRAGQLFEHFERGQQMDAEQSEVFNQVIAKESRAAWSYNGYVKSMAYGYGLKEAVKSWFNYDMATFSATLGDKAHMGQLTGDEVVEYGADDAFWCVALYHRVMQYMFDTNPDVVQTYFNQELPMVRVYADVWKNGLRVNAEAIMRFRDSERVLAAEAVREIKDAIKRLLPFPLEPHQSLLGRDPWYAKNWQSYRDRLIKFAETPDNDNDYELMKQVSGAVSNVWVKDIEGIKKLTGPNLGHYMVMRTLIYDLARQKLFVEDGKTQSDADARGRLQIRVDKAIASGKYPEHWDSNDAPERLAGTTALLAGITKLAGIETRMKLFLTPYSQLVDPETGKMYPVLSSKLATRRMATSFPNPMQLAKRGESTYIRGFYLADNDNHLIVSMDWSGVELVEIGDFSGDPEFKKAFGQLPYEDLHGGAAADVLGIAIDIWKQMKQPNFDTALIEARWLVNLKGEAMEPAKAQKYWRTEVGKGSNFNYWYSGALSTVGQRMGWSSDQMWEATERYRNRFYVAEQWRVNTISELMQNGYLTLRDGHRRNRYEATFEWVETMRYKFGQFYSEGVKRFGEEVIRKVQNRAKNQGINALIQGSCATLMKRSIVRIQAKLRELGWDETMARFMLPIHDEALFSVRHDLIHEFIAIARPIMTDHKDIIHNLPLHCTIAIGKTFEPFDEQKAPMGQVELDEAPYVDWLPETAHGQVLNDNEIDLVIQHMYKVAA